MTEQTPEHVQHASNIEYAVQNETDWQVVSKDFPAVTDTESLDAWVESEQNFRWLCAHHHRSPQAPTTSATPTGQPGSTPQPS